MSLLVLGTVALDNIHTPSGNKSDLLGGSAAHFAMSARFFTSVHLVAIIGEDFPEKHKQILKRKGINLSSLAEGKGRTFRWQGEYKREDFNTALTLATELGVLAGFDPSLAHHQRGIPYVFLANIDPDIQLGLLKMMDEPQLIGLDSMNLWIEHKRKPLLKLMKKVHLFVANDGEARALTGENNLIKAAKRLRRLGPRWIVIKKGENGVIFYSDEVMFSFPAYPVDKVVDPTGAGDTFAGGLMGYLSKVRRFDQKTIKRALIYGTTLASFNVQGFGMTRMSRLTMPGISNRMRELINFMHPH